jgi:hypothetical protein
MSADVISVDLTSADLTWSEHQIAGAEKPARIALLRADAERGTRTVVVRFADGWTRDAIGNQPAGEEMVVISGALSISGLTCGVGEMLIVAPHATRSATSTLDGTAAVVFFSGAGGGWADGVAENAGDMELLTVEPGVTRGARPGLVGEVKVLADAAGAVLPVDADIFWADAHTWAFVPAGTPAPAISGQAVIHTWA